MFNVQDWLNNKAPSQPSGGGGSQQPSGGGFQPPQGSGKPKDSGFQAPEVAIQPEKPFMAEEVDAYGLPYYGTGFKGWARGTFARIFDPKNFTNNIQDAEFRGQAEEQSDDYAQAIEKLTKWDRWGEDIFGISSTQLGESLSAMQAEKQEGEAKGEALGTGISSVTGMWTRALKEGGMTALGAFGAIDYLKRKQMMTRQAVYELSQESDLYRQAKDAGVGEWLLGRGPKWEADWLPNGGTLAENPVVGQLVDPLKTLRTSFQSLSILLDQDTRGKYLPTLKKYWQGSGMAYTMVADAAKRQEFIDRVNAGDDPGLVAAETGNVWTELGGSVFGDPTTYLGVGILGKGSTVLKIPFTSRAITIAGKPLKVPWQKIATTPTFGELLGFGAKARRVKEAARIASAIPDAANEVARMEKVAEAAGGWEKLADEAESFAAVRKMSDNLLGTVKAWDQNLTAGKLPNARTLTTSSVKASQFYRNSHDALGLILSKGGTIDDRLESLNTLRNMHIGDDADRAEAALLAVKEHGRLAMSDSYLQLGKFLSKFEGDEDIAKLIEKTGTDPAEIFGKLAPKLDDFARQFYPSMDEMAEAAAKLSEKGDEVTKARGVIDDLQKQVEAFAYSGKKPKDLVELEKQLEKAKKGFDAAYGRQQELAQAYEQINPLARKGREMLRTYEKTFFRPVKKYMDTVFLAIRPAQYMRQVQSQTALIAMDMGFLDAVEILGRTVATSFSETWTAKMLKSNSDEITKLLGFAPEAMGRGVTAAGEAKGAGFLRVSGNLDTLMSSEITLRTARRELDKILRNSNKILDIKRLEGIFGKDELGVLQRLIQETGSEREAVEQFTKLAKKGNFEAWRHLAMPDNLKDFLQQSKTYEEFVRLQKTAKTRDEFLRGVDDVITRMRQQAKRAAAADPPVVDEATNEVIREAFLEAQDLASKGLMNEAETKIFNNMVNAYEYMRRNLETGAKEFRNAVDLAAQQAQSIGTPEYTSAVRSLDEATGMIHDMYPKYDETARLVREALIENKNLPSLERAQLLDNARFDIPTYTGYTIDELGSLDKKEFERVTWSAYFAWGREYWKQANTEVLTRTVESLEVMAEAAGTSVEEIVAKSSTVREYLFQARKYQQEALIWENNTKYVSNNLAQVANAYGIPTAGTGGAPLSKNLLKILNDNLPEGLEPFTDYKDAQERIDEARIALAQWSNKTKPEEATRAAARINEFLGKAAPPSQADIGATAARAPEMEEGFDFEKSRAMRYPEYAYEFVKKYALDKVGEFKDLEKGEIGNFIDKIKQPVLDIGDVDEATRAAEAKAVTETDMFRALKEQAKKLRAQREQVLNELPPVVHPGTATGAQFMHGNLTDPKFLTDVKAWSDSVTEKWGALQEMPQLDNTKRAALADWQREASKRMSYIKAKVSKVATMQRDDLLLSYDKNYGDLALAYFKPYHYWQTRQYIKSFARFVDHPSWANGYLKYKDAMSRENADMPEWYRYNIAIQDLPGIHLKHPFYINMESALNPIYDLTGTDFNDPYKRVDWISRTVDDLGKTGGTFMPPIQWAIALNLYRKGENDAAQRWMGRVFGQTGQVVKAGLTAGGADINIGNFIQHNEIDPFVNFLSGGMDPNERKRVGRQIAGMIEDGVDPEAALDAMYTQSGDLYEDARRQSVLARSPAELISFFLGVGYKPRTPEDAQVESFYQEYYQLRAQADLMPPDDYRRAWDLLRDKYEFMDTVLLSGKNTPDRESAYTYNVFGRVPPGQARELYEAAGIDPQLAQFFFDTKGELTGMTPTDKQHFMASVADLGAMLSIPEFTTKQDWNNARTQYKTIQQEMAGWFGDDIAEQIDHYYTLDEKGKKNFVQLNPRVKSALAWQTQQVVSNPEVYQFYGGLGSLERFHKGRADAQLEEEFGTEIEATWDQYYEMQMYDPKGANKFKKAHPELNAYSARKKVLMDEALRSIVEFATILPEADEPPELRPNLPTPMSSGQKSIFNYANQPPSPTVEEWYQKLPTETRLIAEYWNGNIRLPNAVVSSLDYQAGEYGYSNGDDLLQAILISMQR